MREEIAHIRQFDAPRLNPEISCPVLILWAPEGILAKDDIVLTEDAVERMVREIADARRVDCERSGHPRIPGGIGIPAQRGATSA